MQTQMFFLVTLLQMMSRCCVLKAGFYNTQIEKDKVDIETEGLMMKCCSQYLLCLSRSLLFVYMCDVMRCSSVAKYAAFEKFGSCIMKSSVRSRSQLWQTFYFAMFMLLVTLSFRQRKRLWLCRAWLLTAGVHVRHGAVQCKG